MDCTYLINMLCVQCTCTMYMYLFANHRLSIITFTTTVRRSTDSTILPAQHLPHHSRKGKTTCGVKESEREPALLQKQCGAIGRATETAKLETGIEHMYM